MTEQSFLKAFESVVSKLTTKWEFGYYGLDDLRQECFFFAWDCLNRYDPSRPLEPFLNTHINNRLRNLKRNKYHRADPPCKSCHDGFPCSDKGICERYRVWSERNGRKANLARPMPFDEWDHSSETFSPVELGEIEVIIDEYLPIELRKDYLRMREDCTISRSKMQAVRDYMKLILASGVYQESDNE